MKRQPHVWAGSVTLLLALSLFLFGCPKRPEVAETTPKAIGPQGVIAMPAPPLPAPTPTVSAPPPTVSAPEEIEREMPAEVMPEAEEVDVAEAEETEGVGSALHDGAETLPDRDAAAPRSPETESGIGPGMRIGETEVGHPGQAPIEEAEVSPSPVAPGRDEDEAIRAAQAQGDIEVTPEPPAQIIEEAEIILPAPVEPSEPMSAEPPPGAGPDADISVAGAEVTAPPSAQPSPAPAPSEPSADAPSPAPVSPPSTPAPEAAVAQVPELTLKDIFFDFDQSVIRDDSNKILAENILWLRTNPTSKVIIEGHCDERGSSEYNLALGERRAKVTRDFMVAGGIDPGRISTISYGKERPFVLGHDEAAWRWNRRAHFVVSPR